jgi:hypothetical protein
MRVRAAVRLCSGLNNGPTHRFRYFVQDENQAGLSTRLPLCPPKPNEFESDGPGDHGAGSPTTRLTCGISGSGVEKPAVGGTSPFCIASTTATASSAPAGTEGVARNSLG